MGISLKGVNLGYMGLDMSLIVEKPELQNVPYQCPAIAYIIEHPDGRILWETGISTRATDEWLSVWQELVDLSRYYLANDTERETIRRAGYERARRDHTWRRRFEDLFAELRRRRVITGA